MTPNQTINPAAAEAAPHTAISASLRGPGLQIRAAREAATMSLEALAQQTKLAKPTLDALERDDFILLNEPVYIRGYYRKVAKALSIAERDLISAYEAVVQQKGPPVPTKLLLGSGDNGLHRARRRSGWSWLLAVILIGALLFLALHFVSHAPPPVVTTVGGLSETLSSTESGKSSSAAAPESSINTASSNATVLPSTPMSEASSSPASAAGNGANATSASASTSPAKIPASAASTTANPAGDTPAGSNEAAAGTGLSLNFKATSWVRIEDTYGKVLLSGVMQAGTHQSIDGRRPLAVFLGNAPGVSVTDAGKPINIAPYVKDNATARFSVP